MLQFIEDKSSAILTDFHNYISKVLSLYLLYKWRNWDVPTTFCKSSEWVSNGSKSSSAELPDPKAYNVIRDSRIQI